MAQPFDNFPPGDLSTTPKPQLPTGGVPNQYSSKFPGATSHPMASKDNIVNALDYMRQNHAGAVINPMGAGKEYFFSAQRNYHNFERYYNKSQFSKLGFRAARDNETLYNENSSWWNDMASASNQWGTLFGLGLKDAFGFGDLTDQKNAAKFERAMNIGSSSKGGISGFTTNLYLNSGYSVGILAEVALEEVAIAGVSLLAGVPSGGTSLAGGGALMAARAGRAGNKLYQGWKVGKNLLRTLDSLKDANKARQYFQTALNSAGKFINPLENTTDFLRGVDKIEDYRNLNNLAKSTMGFGAFYRDVRNIRLAYGESGLEGGMVRNEMEDNLLQEFIDKNGRTPNSQEADAIRDTAAKAGQTTAWLNLPTIYFSNKLVFDNMFKTFNPIRKVTQDVVEKGALGSVVFNRSAKQNAFEIVENGWKGFLKTAKNPRAYARTGLNYFKANLAEGIQESAQEVISGANTDYYTNLWRGTPLKGGYWASVGDNIQKQLTGTGVETFFSGFLMGGMMQPITKAPGYLKDTYSKFKDPTQYKAQKAQGTEQLNEMVNKLNDLYNDPLKYFNSDLANTESQSNYADAGQEASENGDAKAYHDLKDASFYDHVYTALRNGRMDTFKERMEDMKGLTPEEVKESFGLEHTDFLNKLDKSISRAQNIQNRFELTEQKYKNPFNPRAYTPGSLEYIQSSINYLGWQAAQKEFVFNSHSFDRTLERMNDIASTVKNDSKLANVNSADFNALLSFNSAQKEIELLKKEVKVPVEVLTPEMRKDINFKQKKLEYLQDFADSMQEVMESPGTVEDTSGDAVKKGKNAIDLDAAGEKDPIKKAYKAYEKYLKHLAKQSNDYVFKDNIENAFNKIVDHYQLYEDSQRLMDSVNMMLDPNSFIDRARRLSNVKEQLFAQRSEEIESALQSYMGMVEDNRLLQLLADINVFFDPEELDALLNEGKMPSTFYRIQEKGGATGIKRELSPSDPLYTEAVNIIKNWMSDIKQTDISETRGSLEADIERRRQEELEVFNGELEIQEDPEGKGEFVLTEEGPIYRNEINERYDAELAALNQEEVQQEQSTTPSTEKIKLSPTTPIQTLKEYPELLNRLIQAYKNENAKREQDGVNLLDSNWEVLSDEQITNSLPFRNAFVKMHSRARKIISDYNNETGRTEEVSSKEAVKSTVIEPINDGDYNTFVDTGEVNQDIINSIANKIRVGKQLSPREVDIFTNKTSAVEDRLQEMQSEATEVPTQWNRTLRQQISELGYSEEERKAMTPAEASVLVNEGITKEQRDQEELAALRSQEQELVEHRDRVLNEVDNLINAANNVEELSIAEQSIFEIFMDPALRNLAGLTAEMIEEKINAKKQTLAFDFAFDDFIIGEVVIMNNEQETKAVVTGKSANTIFLEAQDNPSKTFSVKESRIKNRIKYKYSSLMNELDMTPEETMTPVEQELSNTSQQNSQEVVDKEVIQRMITNAKSNTDTGWLDNVNECE